MNNHFVTISYTALRSKLIEFLSRLEQRKTWFTPLGIFVALLTTIVVTDFKARWGIEKGVWQGIVYTFCFFSFSWLVIEFSRAFNSVSVDDFIEHLREASTTAKDSRVLFFFKNTDSNGTWHLLVNDCPVFDCYMLPHTRKDDGPLINENLRLVISQKLKINKDDVALEYLHGLAKRSYKMNENTGNNESYYFDFYLVNVKGDKYQDLVKEMFSINGGDYKWKTIEELMNHSKSMQKNGDVLIHIHDHFPSFFTDETSNSFAKSLTTTNA